MQRILGIVGWIGTALVFGAVAARLLSWAGTLVLTPETDRYVVYAALAGLVCVVLYSLGQWREVVAYFRQRNARYGAIASISVVVVLAILVAVNYLSARRNKRWDLTANQQFTLSDQTVKLLQGLKTPVKFLVFDQEGNFERFKTRLDEYGYQSGQVSVEYIDADKRPVQARQYNVDTYGTVVIEYGGRTERVTADTEQALTNGLIKVMTGAQKRVYFVQGHGEKSTTNTERTGYSTIVAALGRDNYGVEPLVLAQQQDVPADASVVVLAGPSSDLLEGEADMLRRYLAKGGHLLVLFDPPDPQRGPSPVLEALLREWAVEPGDDVVVDASGMGQLLGTDASVPVAAQYSAHPITDRFNMLTAYPLARSVTPIAGRPEGPTPQTIIESSARSWAETDVQALRTTGRVEMNADQGDKPGPVSIGVAVSAPVRDPAAPPEDAPPAAPDAPMPQTRLAVIGDSDFASNFALGIQGNRDLFMNTVNWLAQQENLIAIRPKEAADRRITLTAQRTTALFWMSILIVPALVFGTGVYTWSRRR